MVANIKNELDTEANLNGNVFFTFWISMKLAYPNGIRQHINKDIVALKNIAFYIASAFLYGSLRFIHLNTIKPTV